MVESLANLLTNVGFTPHGYCMLWDPALIAIFAGSDAVIAIAYLSISLVIARVLKVRGDMKYPLVGALFAVFLFAGALTHVMSLLTLWQSAYFLQGFVKLFGAAVSFATAVLLWRLLPQILSMPGPKQLEEKNAELTAEIARRRHAEIESKNLNDELRGAHDALEQRVAERTAELEVANKEMEQFIYAASHDLRAPLRALMTIPEWIRDSLKESGVPIPEAVDSDLQEMETQSIRLDTLLIDLRTYAMIGRKGGEPIDFDPAPVIRESLELVGAHPGFEIRVVGAMPSLHLDPTNLALIVRNMVGNAIKHHDRETGVLEIGVGEDGPLACITFTDDGPGIDEKFQERIFEMFTTLRPRDEVEGSGMGLAMVKKIATQAGGSVQVGPNPAGSGSSFRIFLPRSKREAFNARSRDSDRHVA